MARKAVEIKWVIHPSALVSAYKQYGKKVIVAIKALADQIAVEAQNDMRLNARWKDRTGNARSALFSMAEQAAESLVVLYFSHGPSIDYGIFLETSYGMRYAIIMPTMQRIYPILLQRLKALLS